MQINTYVIEVACGGLCRFLGRNELTEAVSGEVYERVNEMVVKRMGANNMGLLLNAETSDSWKVLFVQGGHSLARDKYIFIHVEGK